MAETQNSLFQKCCSYLDSVDWKYGTDKSGDSDVVHFSASGDDLQMNCTIKFTEDIASFYSVIPVKFEDDDRVSGIMAVNEINKKLAFGSLDFDMLDGTVVYRVSNYFGDCTVDTGKVFMDLIQLLLHCVDKYNDKLFMLCKGMIDFSDFLKQIND